MFTDQWISGQNTVFRLLKVFEQNLIAGTVVVGLVGITMVEKSIFLVKPLIRLTQQLIGFYYRDEQRKKKQKIYSACLFFFRFSLSLTIFM